MMNNDHHTVASRCEPRCTHELWEGVRCKLQAGHAGPHYSPPSSISGCALSWRSSSPAVLRQVPRSSPPNGVPQLQLQRLPSWAFLASQARR